MLLLGFVARADTIGQEGLLNIAGPSPGPGGIKNKRASERAWVGAGVGVDAGSSDCKDHVMKKLCGMDGWNDRIG
jgi:hypothetical protein